MSAPPTIRWSAISYNANLEVDLLYDERQGHWYRVNKHNLQEPVSQHNVDRVFKILGAPADERLPLILPRAFKDWDRETKSVRADLEHFNYRVINMYALRAWDDSEARCGACLQSAAHACAHCGTAYCSRACQEADWRARHRGECGK